MKSPFHFSPAPAIRLVLTMLSVGARLLFLRIFCSSQCSTVVESTIRKFLQLHQPIFHVFTNVFLEERYNRILLTTIAYFLISLTSSAFARTDDCPPTHLIFEAVCSVSTVSTVSLSAATILRGNVWVAISVLGTASLYESSSLFGCTRRCRRTFQHLLSPSLNAAASKAFLCCTQTQPTLSPSLLSPQLCVMQFLPAHRIQENRSQ